MGKAGQLAFGRPGAGGSLRLVTLARYCRLGASSRYRIWQYLPLLEAAGWQITSYPLLDDSYLCRLYRTGKRSRIYVVLAYLHRFCHLMHIPKGAVLLLEQELFPYLPAWGEWLLARRGIHIAVDYDDAAHCKYARIPGLRNKIAAVMHAVQVVVVGNRHLAEYAFPYARSVRKIPTVVDVDKYLPKAEYRNGGSITICWIGTAITANRFLTCMIPAFRALQQRYPEVRFRIIGAAALQGGEGLRAEFLPWSEDSEAALIAACDIGIMPLIDDEFERGKCGLKLIQYMAAGLPVVTSPVGENPVIVQHGVNGFLATTEQQWLERLGALIRDAKLRESMGRRGRQIAEQGYSLQYGLQCWQKILHEMNAQTC